MDKNEVELTLGGLKGKEGILNLNRSRMRAIYYRPNGQATSPLPADPYSQMYYFAKGFRAKPPKPEEKPEVSSSQETISCPECGFEAKSKFGLLAHQKKHK